MDKLMAMRTVKKVSGRIKAIPSYPVENYNQWGWWASGADIIWPEKVVSPGVCVVDTGVDYKHPDFMVGTTSRIVNGYDFVNDDTLPADDNGHGTHVAGTISAVMNNKKGFSGISNGKVIAVKVLSAQGWGTSWNIAEGIMYCANRLDVKVINLSLGGTAASGYEYDALDYAVNIKKKLVVAAAGNESTSNYSFPAAWAAPFVCQDGTSTFPADCTGINPTVDNTIHQGVLAVGAGVAWFSKAHDDNNDDYLWVDVDGDGLQITDTLDPAFWDEHFGMDQCAADFSNYGAWVQIVAPGEDILSTVPVSYPFYDEYYSNMDLDNDGYEWYSGTSMAAPHVAAGAVRAWSMFPTLTNDAIKDWLLATGDTWKVQPAMDPNMADPSAGYDSADYAGEAPYCWPDATLGAEFDTSNAVYLNVAAAMNRGAIWGSVYDAITGIPLKGAIVKATIGTSVKDQAVLANDGDPYYNLLNLPAGLTVTVKVNKSGYTYLDQVIAAHTAYPGYYEWGPWLDVGVPPNNKRIHAVANWDGYEEDLDMFVWEPDVSGPGFIVGPWDPGSASGIYLDEGDLTSIPYARWNRDGGFGDFLAMESISLAPKPGSSTIPFYNLTVNDKYDFLLTDGAQPGLLNEYVILRVWAGGKIIGYSEKADTCDTNGINNVSGDADDELWWWAGSMTGSFFTPGDICGVGDVSSGPNGGVWPYRVKSRNSTSGIPERPGGTK
jgi:hypothetical protein